MRYRNSRRRTFKGSPIEVEYKKLSPTPNEFPNLVKHLLAAEAKPGDLGADKLKATKVPMFFIHGDADGVRLEHVAEMFRLKGGEIHGRHEDSLRIEIGHLAQHYARHADAAHGRHRPDGERLFRCRAAKKAMRKLHNL